MKNLMKYEWRKGLFTKLVLLVITAIAELVYLGGLLMKNENWYVIGIIALTACAMVGIAVIGLESLLTFSKDLNTKQSYMLFLTPHSSYEVLGAKVLINGISLLIAGIFFGLLAVLDISAGISRIGGVKELLQIFQYFFRMEIEWGEVARVGLLTFAFLLAQWLLTIVSGELAIVLSATVLAGKKASGFVSFLLFLMINGVVVALLSLLPDSLGQMLRLWTEIGLVFVMTGLLYALTGWVMDRKLSV